MVSGIRKLKHSFASLLSSSSKSDSSSRLPSDSATNSCNDTQLPPPPVRCRSVSNADITSSSSVLSRSSSSISRLSRVLSMRSTKKTCTICLGDLKIGLGRAIFVAECGHSFHFNCIASNVRHGNHVCPICRATWKEIPYQAPSNFPPPPPPPPLRVRSRLRSLASPPRLLDPSAIFEPHRFSDDEPLLVPATSAEHVSSAPNVVAIKYFAEYPVLSASEAHSNFAVLANIRAPTLSQQDRAPVDLVTVLDVSDSMSGSKLALLKQAVLFVIQNLGASDRLSIVVFSSTALRIFPLRRMTYSGQSDATIAVNSLSTDGGTDILSGLKKGARVLEERRERNPVASIMLLSDGRSQPIITPPLGPQLPASLSSGRNSNGNAIPVHSFGFGRDHDSIALHAISDASGGTFSFIESVGMVQDAFARCIGGLLSVVAQEVQLIFKTLSPGLQISSVRSGRYISEIHGEGKRCVIDVGNMYAEEEKGFLLYLSIPAIPASERDNTEIKTSLLGVTCQYKDSTSEEEPVKVEGERVEIRRSDGSPQPNELTVALEVDRHKNRLMVADGIAEAQRLAERGDLRGAKALLEAKRSILLSSASASASAGDPTCTWLDAELRETKERMESRERYEHTGRAYVLSGLSSHSWQRSTTRGDSLTQSFVSGDVRDPTVSGSIGYDTPSMVNMVRMSQNLSLTGPWPLPEH
ncbi:E3 ubiquitin-protein ligase WAV3-like [Neltuma alba]|uniref:E3 ubiquitin-protein ligase WAV3-like n=1 Tax=Neltuma alba TaxID=207710 RepID=UPI0010A3D658|nr:E3 ubiquitin-protein ligase WAV3-like [Prosopis alba]